MELQRVLSKILEPTLAPVDDALIAESVAYLESDAAARSVEADPYWPKWHSPWWHMLLLFELGQARRIPPGIAARMAARVDAMPLHIFPIKPEDSPPGTDGYRDIICHCALGSIEQVLAATGVDVAAALPWFTPWYARYQMADGGANCDERAYLSGEVASSMVGTIAPFEAMLTRPPSEVEDRAAAFLIERRLMNGSATRHNAEERDAARAWLLPCFPRYYFYDVLRGLAALVRWAELRERSLPLTAIAGVATHLATAFPDGVVRLGRQGFAATNTIALVDGAWVRQPASRFPLLDAVSAVGRPSPELTQQWTATRHGLMRLAEAGRITA